MSNDDKNREESQSVEPSEEADVTSSAVWKRFRKHKVATAGVLILVVLITVAIFAPFLAPNDPYEVNALRRLEQPSAQYPLGLDRVGRCIFSRLIYASRISLSVGVISAGVSLIIGVVLGSVAGYYGGIVDHILGRLADGMLSLPAIVIIMTLVLALGTHIFNVMIVIGILGWVGIFRLVRGQMLSLREQEFYLSAVALGASPFKVVKDHLLPNAVSAVIVAVTLRTASAILTESTLSFLGFGIQPPLASWGNMLNAAQNQSILVQNPWMWAPPGIAIAITVLSVNFLGDGLRDALDPTSQLGVRQDRGEGA